MEKQNYLIEQLIMQNRLLKLVLSVLVVTLSAIGLMAARAPEGVTESIRTRELLVVDSNNVIRARVSGDMPDAIMANGHVSKRGAKAAGFMIYDQEGIERGGYVTFDHGNAMLSLDSKYRMVANLIAGPEEDGVSVLNLHTKNSSLELRSDPEGSRLSVSKAHRVTYQHPEIDTLSQGKCRSYKDLEKKYPGEGVCLDRFSQATCDRCFKSEQ